MSNYTHECLICGVAQDSPGMCEECAAHPDYQDEGQNANRDYYHGGTEMQQGLGTAQWTDEDNHIVLRETPGHTRGRFYGAYGYGPPQDPLPLDVWQAMITAEDNRRPPAAGGGGPRTHVINGVRRRREATPPTEEEITAETDAMIEEAFPSHNISNPSRSARQITVRPGNRRNYDNEIRPPRTHGARVLTEREITLARQQAAAARYNRASGVILRRMYGPRGNYTRRHQ